MKTLTSLIVLVAAGLFFYSFKNDVSDGRNKTSPKGQIRITSSMDALMEYTGDLNFRVLGGIALQQGEMPYALGNLRIGEESIPFKTGFYSSDFKASLSGKTVKVEVLDSLNASVNSSGELYFPMPITSHTVVVPDSITIGSTITWNADENNKHGVEITLEYNGDKLAMDFEGTKTIFTQDDQGSYTFTKKDLKDLYKSNSGNNLCILTLTRGSSTQIINPAKPNEQILISYSFASPWFMTHRK